MSLGTYHTLGGSGLRVSPLALGTMTFGEKGWGADRDTALELFDKYLESGGNFIDTADIYSGGRSEELVGEFVKLRDVRERLVISTKFTLGAVPGDPNASGNSRKSMLRALEGSLRRLGTDYVDIYMLHMWDGVTPVDEVMRGLNDLITAGKVRYLAFSDVPAWYAARAQTVAMLRNLEPVCALQLEYSLLERGVELEFPAMCEELGMGIMVWGPLANGMLSGKYRADEELDASKEGRLHFHGAHITPELAKRNDRNWGIISELEDVAKALGRPMAQVALNWVANQPAVGSVIVGATRASQLEGNLQALDFCLPGDLRARLNHVSAPPHVMPYAFLERSTGRVNQGVTAKRAGYFTRDPR